MKTAGVLKSLHRTRKSFSNALGVILLVIQWAIQALQQGSRYKRCSLDVSSGSCRQKDAPHGGWYPRGSSVWVFFLFLFFSFLFVWITYDMSASCTQQTKLQSSPSLEDFWQGNQAMNNTKRNWKETNKFPQIKQNANVVCSYIILWISIQFLFLISNSLNLDVDNRCESWAMFNIVILQWIKYQVNVASHPMQ